MHKSRRELLVLYARSKLHYDKNNSYAGSTCTCLRLHECIDTQNALMSIKIFSDALENGKLKKSKLF